MARPERFELPTLWFEARCSIQLSYGRVRPSYQKLRAVRWGAGSARGEGKELWVCSLDRRRLGELLRRAEADLGALGSTTAYGNADEGYAKIAESSRKRKMAEIWWAWVDLNYRPHPYQGCALAT